MTDAKAGGVKPTTVEVRLPSRLGYEKVAMSTAAAVAKFRDDLIRSLAIAGEAQVPLHSGLVTRFVVFRDAIGGAPVAIIVGKPDLSRPVLVRLICGMPWTLSQ